MVTIYAVSTVGWVLLIIAFLVIAAGVLVIETRACVSVGVAI